MFTFLDLCETLKLNDVDYIDEKSSQKSSELSSNTIINEIEIDHDLNILKTLNNIIFYLFLTFILILNLFCFVLLPIFY